MKPKKKSKEDKIDIIISRSAFEKYSSEKELYLIVKNWIKTNLVGKKIFLKEIDKNIELSWQGLKNDLNEYHEHYEQKLLSFSELPLIIEKSKFIYDHVLIKK